MLTQVLWYGLLGVAAFVALITLWAKKQTKKFKRVHGTGDAYLESTGILYMFKQLAVFDKRDIKALGRENFMDYGFKNKMYHQFLLLQYVVATWPNLYIWIQKHTKEWL